MMFTTKTEYGMRAMVALAKNSQGRPLSLAEISRQEHISRPYLERLFAKLKADNLVKSSKGVGGGYLLARKPEKISVFEIVEALEGALAVFYCMSDSQRKMTCSPQKCMTKIVWHELQKNIIATLRKFTLKDLI
ncbi:MAG TPA: Rrf2 family transcriptional regulator [bacterium]|nr:Rrf2 family transcriptional regulator [bacterium]